MFAITMSLQPLSQFTQTLNQGLPLYETLKDAAAAVSQTRL